MGSRLQRQAGARCRWAAIPVCRWLLAGAEYRRACRAASRDRGVFVYRTGHRRRNGGLVGWIRGIRRGHFAGGSWRTARDAALLAGGGAPALAWRPVLHHRGAGCPLPSAPAAAAAAAPYLCTRRGPWRRQPLVWDPASCCATTLHSLHPLSPLVPPPPRSPPFPRLRRPRCTALPLRAASPRPPPGSPPRSCLPRHGAGGESPPLSPRRVPHARHRGAAV